MAANVTGLASKASLRSTANEIDGKIARETRFYTASLILLANAIGPTIRDHWAIENSLHWVVDMVFRDDNLIRKAPGKDSQGLKRMTAAWNDDFLSSLVAA
jgi:predicted transposase YbfD/YdcC